MKIKYLAIIPAFAVAFALTVAPAFARYNRDNHHRDSQPKVEIDVDNDNDADIDNDVKAVSNTGLNDANRNGSRGTIITGRADALASSDTTANRNETNIDVWKFNELDVDNDNDADVDNDVDAYSNTGKNDANKNGSQYQPRVRSFNSFSNHTSRRGGSGYIETGEAISTAQAVTLVNSNLTNIN